MISKPVPSLSADGTQPLDVGPGGGGAAGLAELLHQHIDHLDVESLVTAHNQVPQADDDTLPDTQPGAAVETEPPPSQDETELGVLQTWTTDHLGCPELPAEH